MKIIRVSGRSGSGKTTFISKLLKILSDLKVGVIKHTRHELKSPDNTKDTGRHFEAGATFVVGLSDNSSELFCKDGCNLKLEDILSGVAQKVDLVIVEGAREFDCPTILLGELPLNAVASNIFISLPAQPDFDDALAKQLSAEIRQHINNGEPND